MIKIISVLGSPSEDEIYDMNPEKAIYKFPLYQKQPLIQVEILNYMRDFLRKERRSSPHWPNFKTSAL